MKETDEELDSKIRESLGRYSLLDVKDYDKIPIWAKQEMIRLNKVVNIYLDTGVRWAEIKKFLLCEKPYTIVTTLKADPLYPQSTYSGIVEKKITFKKEAIMSLGSSIKIVELSEKGQGIFRHPNHDTYLPGPEKLSLKKHYAKELSLEEDLDIAKMRVDISNTKDEKERQRKIQEMFKRSIQIEESGMDPWEANLFKKAYSDIWADTNNCMRAFSLLQKAENQETLSLEKEENYRQGNPIFLAVAQIWKIENCIQHAACFINHDVMGKAQDVIKMLKIAEIRKDKGLPASERSSKGYRVLLPVESDLSDWNHLHRNVLFRKSERE